MMASPLHLLDLIEARATLLLPPSLARHLRIRIEPPGTETHVAAGFAWKDATYPEHLGAFGIPASVTLSEKDLQQRIDAFLDQCLVAWLKGRIARHDTAADYLLELFRNRQEYLPGLPRERFRVEELDWRLEVSVLEKDGRPFVSVGVSLESARDYPPLRLLANLRSILLSRFLGDLVNPMINRPTPLLQEALHEAFVRNLHERLPNYFPGADPAHFEVETVALLNRFAHGIRATMETEKHLIQAVTDTGAIEAYGISADDFLAAMGNAWAVVKGETPAFTNQKSGIHCEACPKVSFRPPARQGTLTQTLTQYAAFTRTTACNPGHGTRDQVNLDYLALGLCSEAGEVAGKLKKILRGDIPAPTFDQIADELGDVAWYWVRLAEDLGFTPLEILEINRAKLEDRKDRQVIKGSGDAR